jgi:hypothetical protein
MLDFDEIRKNAKIDGIPLGEICIFYDGLTDEQVSEMDRSGLIADKASRRIMARFAPDGSVMFPEKAVGVYTLAS